MPAKGYRKHVKFTREELLRILSMTPADFRRDVADGRVMPTNLTSLVRYIVWKRPDLVSERTTAATCGEPSADRRKVGGLVR